MNTQKLSDVGLIGLAVMGENIVLNMANHGYRVSVWNRTFERTQKFLSGRAVGKEIVGFEQIADFCASLATPRKIMILVKAGAPVDATLEHLLPHLSPGDIVIDGGNSYFKDTVRRSNAMPEGILYMGCGVSGGEEGALKGPSLMPAGPIAAWEKVAPILTSIAAKSEDGVACCDYLSTDGAGHYVKMIHNGIEYADMQLISEIYALLRAFRIGTAEDYRMLTNSEIADIFARWNQGDLNSYLIEITAQILRRKDPETQRDLIDVILDTAGQKGTGKWTAIDALQMNAVSPTITEAVFVRSSAANLELRQTLSGVFALSHLTEEIFFSESELPHVVSMLQDALYAAKICVYAQGFSQIQAAKKEYGWSSLSGRTVAMLWRGGCIIRAQMLNEMMTAFQKNEALESLLIDPVFAAKIADAADSIRCVMRFNAYGIPMPALSSAFNYLFTLTSPRLAANLIQAQRDFFGAHTYERTDAPRGQFFHTDWLNLGGSTTSSAYNN